MAQLLKPAKRKPRLEERQIFCDKCKRIHQAHLLTGVTVGATIAALKALRCPRCNAHLRHLELV
jgi:uncharacterized paraquat-inducible protein A